MLKTLGKPGPSIFLPNQPKRTPMSVTQMATSDGKKGTLLLFFWGGGWLRLKENPYPKKRKKGHHWATEVNPSGAPLKQGETTSVWRAWLGSQRPRTLFKRVTPCGPGLTGSSLRNHQTISVGGGGVGSPIPFVENSR